MQKPHGDDVNAGNGDQAWQDDVEADDPVGDIDDLVHDAPAPARRADGSPVGSVRSMRSLTAAQQTFADGIIAGLTQRQAYRDAYPSTQASDRVISSNAAKLMRHPLISLRLQQAWGETIEHLADDPQATRRYVMRQLLTLSKSGQTEATRVKALELMGRSVGLWRDQQQQAPQPSAEALKRDLARHLKLLKG